MAVKTKAAPKPSQYTEVAPNARRTLQALREMGYDSFASVMDLIDNSIDAGAKRVAVTVREIASRQKDKAITITIEDDGKGMDEKTLAEALRLGSDIEYEAQRDLGKYGMGLVTASLSMARTIHLLTRLEGKTAYEADFDMGVIERENKFVITLRPAESKKVVGVLDKHGTIVTLSNIDRINDRNVARFAANLRTKMGQVYRHFLAKGLNLVVNGRKVERYDPLMLEHPETEVVLDLPRLEFGDGTVGTLKVVELPELGTQGDSENNIFPHNSGFYVVRNGREIVAGDTFGFYRHHHSYSRFRAEIAYTGETTAFHEDIKKASIHPDPAFLDKLRKLTEKLIAESGRRGRDRGGDEPVKLTHKAAQETINTRFALIQDKPVEQVVAAVRAGTAALPPIEQKPDPDAPKAKRGRPTKEEQERREVERKAAEEAAAAAPPKPQVTFIEVDGGEKGRFFQAETDKKGNMTIQYNSRHPLVRMAADAKQPKVAALLDIMAFSLARAEADVPEGKKLVNRACDYLALLASA